MEELLRSGIFSTVDEDRIAVHVFKVAKG